MMLLYKRCELLYKGGLGLNHHDDFRIILYRFVPIVDGLDARDYVDARSQLLLNQLSSKVSCLFLSTDCDINGAEIRGLSHAAKQQEFFNHYREYSTKK
jgi:hypothetical protein